MNNLEMIRFLSALKNFVSSYWKGRIEEIIVRLGGKPK